LKGSRDIFSEPINISSLDENFKSGSKDGSEIKLDAIQSIAKLTKSSENPFFTAEATLSASHEKDKDRKYNLR